MVLFDGGLRSPHPASKYCFGTHSELGCVGSLIPSLKDISNLQECRPGRWSSVRHIICGLLGIIVRSRYVKSVAFCCTVIQL